MSQTEGETPVVDAEQPSAGTSETSPDIDALITELRASLASSQTLLSSQTTRLIKLDEVEAELAQVKDQHAFALAAKEAGDARLKEETKKREVAEELAEELKAQVETLRGQVEQARRGVMTLQKQEKERKRMSMMGGSGLGLVQPSEGIEEEAPLSATVTDKASKRASVMVRNQRRISSHSESGEGSLAAGVPAPSTSPAGTDARTGLRTLKLGAQQPALPSQNVPTGDALERSSPPPNKRTLSSSPKAVAGSLSPSKRDSAAAKEEAARLRAELAVAQKQLAESEEARFASETCLKALREFIATGSGSDSNAVDLTDSSAASALKGISLPPLPTDKEEPEHLEPEPKKQSGKGAAWNFKIWRQPASPAVSTAVEPPATPQPSVSRPTSVRSTSTNRISPLPTPNELEETSLNAVPSSSTPLANFVSSWSKGVTSTSTPITPMGPPDVPPKDGAAAPSTTRKISNFFGGFKREDKASTSGDFDAKDAVTSPHDHTEKLEPSLMPEDAHDVDQAEVTSGVGAPDEKRSSNPTFDTESSAAEEGVTPATSPSQTEAPLAEEGKVEADGQTAAEEIKA